MLNELQSHLTGIYQVDPGCDIRDFLVTDPAVARILGNGSLIPDTRETVLLKQADDVLELCIYLDGELLSRLEGCEPTQNLRVDQLDDLWTVLEGLSHFNYLVFSASQDKPVTLLELEMQAEIDKFVCMWLLALAQRDSTLADRLHGWLFDEVSFNPRLSPDQRERYEAANAYAGRFCHGLRRRLQRNIVKGIRELRRFYRLPQPEKISHIHARAYN